MNSRMDELQAAILRVKLHHLRAYMAKRRLLAMRYRRELPAAILPSEAEPGEHVYHLFPILVPNREAFRRSLWNAGVGSLVHYAVPVHCIAMAGPLPDESFPEACRWANRVVSLPLHPNLHEEAQGRVIEVVRKAVQ